MGPDKALLHRKIQRRALQRKAATGESQAAAPMPTGGGAGLAEAQRQPMERAFGADFSGVRVHTGGEAHRAAESVSARAFTTGSDVYFRDGEYAPDSGAGKHLLAHELAHVVQQGSSGGASGGAQLQALDVSQPGDAAEQRADAAADAVVANRPVPDVGGAGGGVLHRAPIETNGGTFDTPKYARFNKETPSMVGADIDVVFTPNDLVTTEADGIGLVQTVKTTKNDVGSHPQGASQAYADITLGQDSEDPGRAIDQNLDVKPPSTNPLYAVKRKPGEQLRELSDGAVSENGGQQHGHRLTNGHVKDARIHDEPRKFAAKGDAVEASFEVNALVINGPLKDTYLGAIQWGYKKEAGVKAGELDPKPIKLVSAGAPSNAFAQAAAKWNQADIHGEKPVQLPVTTVPSRNDDRPVSEILPHHLRLELDSVTNRLLDMDYTSPDRKVLLLRQAALKAEIETKKDLVNRDMHGERIDDDGRDVGRHK
jgi:hypothetical protein